MYVCAKRSCICFPVLHILAGIGKVGSCYCGCLMAVADDSTAAVPLAQQYLRWSFSAATLLAGC